ncbi:MAG: zincin-like metallopeptidase domain-containing protein, partial [Candidatus Gastranaerophilaceae bacterium]
KSNFKDNEGYYSTLLHEMTHWTGHKDRLNRLNKYDIEDRAYEELIAEIGASFLCAEFGITPNIDNNASYINSWLQALSNDKNFIFKASHEATKAVNYITQTI